MRQILFTLLLIPALLFAQDDERYLAGAVPVIDGKVSFSREIEAPAMSKQDIYKRLLNWGEKNYNSKTSRVAYKNEEKGEIGILAEVPSDKLSLDETTMRCRIIIEVKDKGCKLVITNIKYEYNVPYQKDPERYVAEEWITDEYGLNRDKSKLNRVSGGFRRATIDYADNIFNSAYEALDDNSNRKSDYGVRVTDKKSDKNKDKVTIVKNEASKPEMVANVNRINPNPNDRIVVNFSDGKSIENARWRGIGTMSDSRIIAISIGEDVVNSGLADGDKLTISLIRNGASDDEAWAVIKSHKLGATFDGSESILIVEIDEILFK